MNTGNSSKKRNHTHKQDNGEVCHRQGERRKVLEDGGNEEIYLVRSQEYKKGFFRLEIWYKYL
jgi:hypothetical protein